MVRFLSWYHSSRPAALERVEAMANLIIGKDMTLYGRKPAVASKDGRRSNRRRARPTQALRSVEQ